MQISAFNFTYENELTLINIILYLYTFSLTYIYVRTLYKTKGRYMCVIACIVGIFRVPASANEPQKAKRKISP